MNIPPSLPLTRVFGAAAADDNLPQIAPRAALLPIGQAIPQADTGVMMMGVRNQLSKEALLAELEPVHAFLSNHLDAYSSNTFRLQSSRIIASPDSEYYSDRFKAELMEILDTIHIDKKDEDLSYLSDFFNSLNASPIKDHCLDALVLHSNMNRLEESWLDENGASTLPKYPKVRRFIRTLLINEHLAAPIQNYEGLLTSVEKSTESILRNVKELHLDDNAMISAAVAAAHTTIETQRLAFLRQDIGQLNLNNEKLGVTSVICRTTGLWSPICNTVALGMIANGRIVDAMQFFSRLYEQDVMDQPEIIQMIDDIWLFLPIREELATALAMLETIFEECSIQDYQDEDHVIYQDKIELILKSLSSPHDDQLIIDSLTPFLTSQDVNGRRLYETFLCQLEVKNFACAAQLRQLITD